MAFCHWHILNSYRLFALELDKDALKVESFFSKQRYNNSDMINEKFLSDLIKTLSQVCIGSKRFSQPQYSVIHTYFLLVLEGRIVKLFI